MEQDGVRTTELAELAGVRPASLTDALDRGKIRFYSPQKGYSGFQSKASVHYRENTGAYRDTFQNKTEKE